MAQEVRCWPLIAETRIRSQVRQFYICGEPVVMETGISPSAVGFPLSVSSHQLSTLIFIYTFFPEGHLFSTRCSSQKDIFIYTLFFPEGHLYLHVLPRRTSLFTYCSSQKDIFIYTLFFPEWHFYLHVVLPRRTNGQGNVLKIAEHWIENIFHFFHYVESVTVCCETPISSATYPSLAQLCLDRGMTVMHTPSPFPKTFLGFLFIVSLPSKHLQSFNHSLHLNAASEYWTTFASDGRFGLPDRAMGAGRESSNVERRA